MSKVLIVNPYYYPGWRSGGPQQTIKNICDAFGDTNEIYILTQNFDFGSSDRYDVPICKWIDLKNVKIKYVDGFNYESLLSEYKKFDVIYTCGLFELNTRLLLRINKNHLMSDKKLYVAPMGVFSEKAIQSKKFKKKIFLHVGKLFGWFQNVIWSFTSESERQDAINELGIKAIQEYIIAEDMPRSFSVKNQLEKIEKKMKTSGELNVIFLSRICAQKNLMQCIDVLKQVAEGRITFDIYGVKEDMVYWQKCAAAISELPSNVQSKYCGEVNPEDVLNIFAHYDVFLFPTKGENYGHVIYEALAAGCIPIISNLTPWKDLDESKCGRVIDFDNKAGFVKAIKHFLLLNEQEIKVHMRYAIEYANRKRILAIEKTGYGTIFKGES